MATLRTDILQNNNAIVITNNDIVWTLSDDQHIVDTINMAPGWEKENPADGVFIIGYLKSKGLKTQLKRSIILNLTSDGYTCNTPIVQYNSDGTLNVNPNASR